MSTRGSIKLPQTPTTPQRAVVAVPSHQDFSVAALAANLGGPEEMRTIEIKLQSRVKGTKPTVCKLVLTKVEYENGSGYGFLIEGTVRKGDTQSHVTGYINTKLGYPGNPGWLRNR